MQQSLTHFVLMSVLIHIYEILHRFASYENFDGLLLQWSLCNLHFARILYSTESYFLIDLTQKTINFLFLFIFWFDAWADNYFNFIIINLNWFIFLNPIEIFTVKNPSNQQPNDYLFISFIHFDSCIETMVYTVKILLSLYLMFLFFKFALTNHQFFIQIHQSFD